MDFAQAFKSDEFADVELVLLCRAEPCQLDDSPDNYQCSESIQDDSLNAAEGPPRPAEPHVIDSFPAHRVFLCRSDYFKAQVHRWQPEGCKDPTSSRKRDRNSRDDRPELHLTLDSADQQAAAEAVIATLYSARQPILDLCMEQLVQAVFLSDRLQLADAAQQAIVALQQQINSVRMPQAVIDLFSNLAVWPDSLLPAVPTIVSAWPQRASHLSPNCYGFEDGEALRRMLLAVFGKLNEVWANRQLQELLMKLPLSAMELLLSADELVVDSEDTVLYTAAQYVAWHDITQDSAKRRLANVIRSPWLSTCCLQAAVLAAAGYHNIGNMSDDSDSADDDDEPFQLLHQHKHKLTALFSLRLLSLQDITSRVSQNIPNAPPSWLLRARSHQDAPSVSVTWRLGIDELREACHTCWVGGEPQLLNGPTSPPKTGVGWHVILECGPGSGYRGTTKIGLYAEPVGASRHKFYRYDFAVDVWASGCGELRHLKAASATSDDVGGRSMFGWQDFFDVGEMTPEAEGLDMSAWIEAGWPESGELEIELVICHVDGQECPPSYESNHTDTESDTSPDPKSDASDG